MKKIISFVLSLGMMLSMLSIIPAEAAIVENYPYIYEDFETGRGTASGSVATWVGDGAGVDGTNGALYFNMTKDATDANFELLDSSIMTGKVKMSAWVKLDTTKTKLKDGASFGFVFWAPGTLNGVVTPTRWMTSWTVKKDNFNSGEWVYVEYILNNWNGIMNGNYVYTPEHPGANIQFAPRLGSPGDGKLASALAADSPTQELCWYLDDFIIEPITEPYGAEEEEEEKDPAVLVDVDFSQPMSAYNSQLSVGQSLGAVENGYFHFQSSGNEYNNIDIKTMPIKYNKVYKFSFRAKANDAATTDGYLKLIAIRKGFQDANDPFYYYQFVRCMDTETGEEMKLTTEWRDYECYFTRQVKAAYHKPLTFMFRAYDPDMIGQYGDSGREPVNFDVDDIKLVELPTVTNGDFEWLKNDIVTTLEDSNMNNNDSKLYGTFYGWRDVNATVAVAEGHTGARSAKITVNAQGGHAEQGVYFVNGSQNVIKFWAKGEGNSVGKNIQIKLDRDVTTMDPNDVYGVDTEIIGENLVLTDDWQEYTVRYDLNAAVPAGADPNAEPRSPFMSFLVDGGAAGLTYYVDDIAVEAYIPPAPPHPYPYVTDMAVSGTPLVGEVINFTYLYNSEVETEEMEEGYSHIRVVKELPDGKKVYLGEMTSEKPAEGEGFVPKYSYDYVVTDAAVGGKIKFEVMPFSIGDSEGNGVVYGSIYTSEATDMVKPSYVISPALDAFDEANGSITGTLQIENNKLEGDSIDVFLAIVLYDANGGIIRYDSKPISVGANSTDNIALSVATANVEGLAPVAYAKAFVWGGSGIFDTDLVTYAETITVDKVTAVG